jgi:putative hemolysin
VATSPFSSAALLPAGVPSWAGRVIDALTGLATLRRLYDAHGPFAAATFVEQAVAALDIAVAPGPDLDRVPASGPLLVVANHPHGALDGLVLAQVLRRVRPDVKLLGNELLARIPEMRPHVIPVDVFAPGAGRNAGAVRSALAWLSAGHVLVVFPAGEVSHVRTASGRLLDGPWRRGAARLAAQAGAPVLPVFVHGRNSAWFERAGRLAPWLRTALLPRELASQRGRRVDVTLGRSVTPRRLLAIGDAAAQTAYLRLRTYGLADVTAPAGRVRRGGLRPQRPEAVAPPLSPDAIAREVESLPASACLVERGPWRVMVVRGHAAPTVLQEIGRLRERTFRAAGEGTGRASDLDRFDGHYQHLFVWQADAREIVGAYRVAATDDVYARHGLGGFYTRTLFRYSHALLRDIGPALELGRSFVREEYQRDYQPLLLLWRGIGALVAANPRYRMLFGPVSISADYASTTRTLLARFLLATRPSLLRRWVEPRQPLRDDAPDADALVRSRVATSLTEVDELVRDLESGQRGLPVLLRHYLKLNAKLLGFSVDAAFGGVLDGLVVVDLLDVDRALLARYFGRDAAQAFIAAHAPAGVLTPVVEPA